MTDPTPSTITLTSGHYAQWRAVAKQSGGRPLDRLLITPQGDGYVCVSTDGHHMTTTPVTVTGTLPGDVALRLPTVPRKNETLTITLPTDGWQGQVTAQASKPNGTTRLLGAEVVTQVTDFPDWRQIKHPLTTMTIALDPALLVAIAAAITDGGSTTGICLAIEIDSSCMPTMGPMVVTSLEGTDTETGTGILMPMRLDR